MDEKCSGAGARVPGDDTSSQWLLEFPPLRGGKGWARIGVRIRRGFRAGGEAGWVVWVPRVLPLPHPGTWAVPLEKAVDPRQLWEKGEASLRDVSLNGQLLLRMEVLGGAGCAWEIAPPHSVPAAWRSEWVGNGILGEGGRGSLAQAPPRTLWVPAPCTLVAGNEQWGRSSTPGRLPLSKSRKHWVGQPAFWIFFKKWGWMEGCPLPQFTDGPGTTCCCRIRPGCPTPVLIYLVPGD